MSFFSECRRYIVEYRNENGKLEAVGNYDTLQEVSDELEKYPLAEGHSYEIIDRKNWY